MPMVVVVWLVVCVLGGVISTFVMVGFARRRTARGIPIRYTGEVVRTDSPAADRARLHVVGAGVLTGRFGKAYASWPLAVLDVDQANVMLRLRPRWLGLMYGVVPLRVVPGPDVEVFPARGGLFKTRYVGIRGGSGEGYFATRTPQVLLGALHDAGCRVSDREERFLM